MTQEEILKQYGPRESMAYDVIVVGAGPAGLASAIALKQHNAQLSVCVLEKGSEAGAHILSGAVMDPRALEELFPNWRELGCPLEQVVTADEVLVLTRRSAFKTPNWLVPRSMHNAGNYVISLSNVVRWLAQQAEALGVEIFAGFAAAEVLYNAEGAVIGVATGNMGLGKDGAPTEEFALGMELHARYTVFAEGARGHLGKQLIEKFDLMRGRDPASYAIGIKELWEVAPEQAKPGLVVHTALWPMDMQTFGGGFLYHLGGNKVTLGLVVGLDYQNPWLSPFEEMQRWKSHPAIARHLQGGRRIGYGARAINSGGLASMPQLAFAGGVLVGCEAGTMNAARIKGSHAAIKSGMLAAQAIAEAIAAGRAHDVPDAYPQNFRQSWLYQELASASNFKIWFKKGFIVGSVMTFIEQWLLPKLGIAVAPWKLHRTSPDHVALRPASACTPIAYPKPDGVLRFDRLSSVFLSNTNHAEGQPAHLNLRDASIPVALNLAQYAGPETRYCPAGVYEFVQDASGADQLRINAQNCVHCKTCDIKDPTQNIVWVSPEGGGGPNYVGM